MSIYETDKMTRELISVQLGPMKHCTEYSA